VILKHSCNKLHFIEKNKNLNFKNPFKVLNPFSTKSGTAGLAAGNRIRQPDIKVLNLNERFNITSKDHAVW